MRTSKTNALRGHLLTKGFEMANALLLTMD